MVLPVALMAVARVLGPAMARAAAGTAVRGGAARAAASSVGRRAGVKLGSRVGGRRGAAVGARVGAKFGQQVGAHVSNREVGRAMARQAGEKVVSNQFEGMSGSMGQKARATADAQSGLPAYDEQADAAEKVKIAQEKLAQESSKLGGVLKKMAGPGIILGLIALPGLLKKFGAALVDSQKHLQAYSGVIAVSMAKLEIGRIMRDLKMAGATSQSFSQLAQSQNRLERATQPFEEMWTNATNKIVAGMQNVAAWVLEGIAELPLMGALRIWLATQNQGDIVGPMVQNFMMDVASGRHGAKRKGWKMPGGPGTGGRGQGNRPQHPPP